MYYPKRTLALKDDCVRTVPPINWLLLAKHGEVQVQDVRPRLKASLLKGIKEFTSELLNVLDAGYLRLYVDEYYIPRTRHFLVSHYKHEMLTCGIDPKNGSVTAVGWNKDGEFSFLKIPLSLFVAGTSTGEGWPESWGYRDRFDQDSGYSDILRKQMFLVTPSTRNASTLDVDLINHQLEDALLSRCTYEQYIGDPMTDWHEDEGEYGLKVYQSFARAIENSASARESIDLRTSRLFWEHKVIMTERLAYLRKQGCPIPVQVDVAYQKCSYTARMIHLQLVEMSKDGNTDGVATIIADIKRLEQMEREALQSVIGALSKVSVSSSRQSFAS